MASHTALHPTIEAYLDGELPSGSRVRVRWHLLLCPDCRRHAQLVRAIKRVLAKGRARYPDPGDRPRIRPERKPGRAIDEVLATLG